MFEYFIIYFVNDIIPQKRTIVVYLHHHIPHGRSDIFEESNAICSVLIRKEIYPNKRLIC